MLSWLTGAKGSDEAPGAYCDTFIEAPETPAPVFAVRAFKHALFGTPKASETQDHFDEIAKKMPMEAGRASVAETETRAVRNQNAVKADMLGLSPSKPNGILMTPGTTRRNKTVTFGAQVVDNEGKKPSRSGLPNSFPGKFPSPWTPKTEVEGLGDLSNTSTGSQKRTKLTQTLHDVRDSSKTREGQLGRTATKAKDDMDITLDFMEPRSQSGKYWKQEYDAYAEKTQREVKKLLLKQKAAKEYARDKDIEVNDLTKQLRLEQSKVEQLEARKDGLERELKDIKGKLQQETKASPFERLKTAQDEAAKLRLENWKLRDELDRARTNNTKTQSSPRKRPGPAAEADIWADAVLSSPFIDQAGEKPSKNPAEAKTTPRKNASPLKQRDVNTLETTQPRSNTKRQDRDVNVTPKRSASKRTPRSSRDSQILPEDSIDLSLALPEPSIASISHPTPRSAGQKPPSARKTAAERTIDDLLERYSPTKSIIMSSPPPAFNRLALPMCMPPATSDLSKGSTQQPQHRKKPSLKESFAKAASPSAAKAEGVQNSAPSQTHAEVHVDIQQNESDDAKRRSLSEEKKLAAMQRIAARRAGKAKAR